MRTIYLDKLLRLTLTRKGRAIAKHPLLRTDVIETVKAQPLAALAEPSEPDESLEPLWVTLKAAPADGDDDEPDWYDAFEAHILTVSGDDIPEDWVESFNAKHPEWAAYEDASDDTTKKAQKQNYPSSEGPFAGPHHSFPINSQKRVFSAAKLIGHAANPAAVKQRIIAIARARGYKLPKSWQKATKSSMDKAQFDELVARLGEAIKGVIAPAEPEAPAAPEDAVKAAPKVQQHNHLHPHATMRGYQYEHSHAHPVGDGDHDTSETAHAHEHVAKADAELDPEVIADLKGLDARVADLSTKLAELETEKAALVAGLQSKDAELAEKATALEAATAAATASKEAHDAMKAELDQATEMAKQPLIAGVPSTEKASGIKDVKGMKFDDAFSALLHG